MDENKKIKRNNIIRNLVPFLGLVVLIIVFSFTTEGKFLATRNLTSLIGQSMVTMVAASGTIFVMAHGNLDFSLGGGAAMIGTFVFMITGGQNLIVILALCIVMGIAVGLLTSVVHIKGRIPAFMIGLAMMFIGRGINQGITATTVMSLTPDMMTYANNGFYAIFMVVVFILCLILFNFTRIGKLQKLIGSNPAASALSGISEAKYKTIAFVISGITLGIATFLLILRGGGVSPALGQGLESDVLIALILGGVPLAGGSATRIRAVIIGTLTFSILNNGLTIWGVDTNYINIIKGVIFLAVVFISIDRRNMKIVT